MEATTALRKITSLRKRIKAVQGGQGAGKTIAILMLLINHAAGNPNREILIISSELTKMRLTVIKDFVKVMRDFGVFEERRFVSGTLYRFRNGSFIKFIGLDKEDVGKGLRSHVAYFNEANKMDFESYHQVASRADVVFADWNPDNEFWIHDEVITRDDCDFITLTFNDNEMLGEAERSEILRYKEKGYNTKGDEINSYWANKWRVYGLGLPGKLEGLIFPNYQIYSDLPTDINLYTFFGVDWGGNDPNTVVEVNISKAYKRMYLKQHLYQPLILNSKLIDLVLNVNPQNDLVVCDNARKDKIYELQMASINAIGASKGAGSKMEHIDIMQEYDIYIHKNSIDTIQEFNSYFWAKDKKTGKVLNKPIDGNDHIIDPTGYVCRYYHKNYFE